MIVYKQEFIEEGKNAKSIRDFWYRGSEFEESGGTGIRDLAIQYMRERKVIDRRLILKNNGCTLEITTIFRDKACFEAFMQHDLRKNAGQFFSSRSWRITAEIYEIAEETSIKSEGLIHIIKSFTNMSLEEIKNKITQLANSR